MFLVHLYTKERCSTISVSILVFRACVSTLWKKKKKRKTQGGEARSFEELGKGQIERRRNERDEKIKQGR